MKPLTREEVLRWEPLGPMALDPKRVLAVFDERDSAEEALVRLEDEYALLLQNVDKLRDALTELVQRRERAVLKNGIGTMDGTDGRYARARKVLEETKP